MSLEVRGFCESGEPRAVFSFSDATGVLAAGGEFVDQALETMNRPSLRGLFGALLSLNRLAGLGLGDRIAAPANRVKFLVLKRHGGEGLADMPFYIVCKHT